MVAAHASCGLGSAQRGPTLQSNLEIKARTADPARMRERARGLATARVGLETQTDTYFRTAAGRLKLRESSRSGAELVAYERPDVPEARWSHYEVVPVQDPKGLGALLSRILGVHRVVRKQREVLLYRNVRIHLDRVDGLGSFVELEAVQEEHVPDAVQQERVAHLMRELGIRPADLVASSYEALLGPEEPDDA